MNIYDYFKSADVAEHCKSIGHRFNTIEMAWIIDKSDKTINQRCKALVVWERLLSLLEKGAVAVNDIDEFF